MKKRRVPRVAGACQELKSRSSARPRRGLVVENARLGGGHRSGWRAVESGNESQRRQVGDDELRGAGIDEALDVEGLIDARIDHVVIGSGVEQVVGAAPHYEESLVVDLGMGGEVVGDLLANVDHGDGKRIRGAEGKYPCAFAGDSKAVCIVGSAVERVFDRGLGREGCRELLNPHARSTFPLAAACRRRR